jgi:hypothetical protein
VKPHVTALHAVTMEGLEILVECRKLARRVPDLT